MRHLIIALGCVLLCACASKNPYQADALPLPPAPPAAMGVDLSAYPAPPIDYSAYQDWRWRQPPASAAGISSESIQHSVAQGLDQRGLRPSRDGAADLLVQANVRQARRVQHVHDYDGWRGGGYYGSGPYGHHRGLHASVPLTRNYTTEIIVVDLSLIDARSGQTVWQGSAEVSDPNEPAQRMDALRKAIIHSLSTYPPS